MSSSWNDKYLVQNVTFQNEGLLGKRELAKIEKFLC